MVHPTHPIASLSARGGRGRHTPPPTAIGYQDDNYRLGTGCQIGTP